MKNYRLVSLVIAMTLPLLLFECFNLGLFVDPNLHAPNGHFYIVSAVSFLSSIIAISVGIVGSKLRNIKISFLALSFISLAQMFSVHGLSTPDFLIKMSHLPSIAAQLSMLLATFWIWLSSLPSDHRLVEWFAERQRFLLPIWIGALTIFGLSSMFAPHLVDFIPITNKPFNWIFMAFTVILNIFSMYRYYQSYEYTQFPLQISIVYSSGWIIVSQVIMTFGEVWKLSWWLYHFLLLASMIIMLVGLIKQYFIRGNFVGSLLALFTNDPIERITSSISPRVKDLVIATEKKDTYTAGHTFRVTMYALKLAEELHLKPEKLRSIVQGTLLHDVGKMSVPDEVLNKPGRLTLDERILIEAHPVKGYEMCRDLGFTKEELSIILSHHEKWDGSGYPEQLQGEVIPYLARIVAVADVYDALTSERSYRKAWTHEDAMKYLIEQKGSHFDPKCVEAWDKLCKRNPDVYLYPAQTINDDTTGRLVSTI
ncbi:HD-GYP domain-containing protein [Bacillus sp. CGMCC 1.16607]|uniref:HD-GYP domain-containing protein n=1 Tax=Bacillus sp. CGMCC 1.16607 TaxID=3351842 RepID=UPI00362BE7F0